MIQGWHVTGFGLLPLHFNVFVETGTFYGHTTRAAAQAFQRVYTIELSCDISNRTQSELSAFNNINFIVGDSAVELGPLCQSINEPVLYFLDAHFAGAYSAGNEEHNPLYEELGHIAQRSYADLVIIDDFRLFGKAGISGIPNTIYPPMQFDWRDISIKGCLDVLCQHNRTAQYKVKNDMFWMLLRPREPLGIDLLQIL